MEANSKAPFFSIITPVYNAETFLQDTVRSVEAQTFTDYEHLLIDDGSSDGSVALCEAYVARDPRAKLIRMPQNGGVSAVRNTGIQLARGKYVSFLDSDDYWQPQKLQLQHDLIARTGAKFVYGSYHHIRENGAHVKTITVPPTSTFKTMLNGSVMGCLTVAIEANLLKRYSFKNIFHEDYLLWLEILRDNDLTAHGVTEPIAHYRLRPGSRSANKKEAAAAQWRILRHHLGIGLLACVPLFISYAVAGVLKHKSKR